MEQGKNNENGVDFGQLMQAAEAMKMLQAATPAPPPPPAPAPSKSAENTLVDSVTKILVAVCTAAVLWTANSVNTNTQTISEMGVESRVWRKGIDEDIRKLKDFASAPRFTAEQDSQRLAPIVQMQQRHDVLLTDRGDWITNMDRRMNTIETRYETILEKLSIIQADLHKEDR